MKGTSDTMKKWGLFLAIGALLAIVLPFFIYSLTSKRRVEKRYVLRDIDTIEELIKYGDISTMYEELSKKMIRELEYQKISLPEKFHRMDFFLRIQPILSEAKDQNTKIIFGVPSYYPVLPFKARFVDGKLYVVESVTDLLKPGNEIVKVDGKNVREFLNYLEILAPADSPALLYKKTQERFFQLPFIERREKYTLEVKGKGKITISYVPKSSYIEKLREIRGHEWDYKFETLGDIGLLRFRTFNLYGQDIQDLEDLLKSLPSKNLRYLVIDLRDCEGGSMSIPLKVLAHFVEKEVKFEREYAIRTSQFCGGQGNGKIQEKTMVYSIKPKKPMAKAKLVVLVDRTTSNEALDFAYLVEKTGLGEVYGEIPDQSLSHTFMVSGKSLPSVGMFASISCARWNDKGKLVVKNPVRLSTQDYIGFLSGKEDVLLENVLKLLKSFR